MIIFFSIFTEDFNTYVADCMLTAKHMFRLPLKTVETDGVASQDHLKKNLHFDVFCVCIGRWFICCFQIVKESHEFAFNLSVLLFL